MADFYNIETGNGRRVLRSIWKHDGISRIEIAGKLDLDKSTITKITNRLLKKGLIITTEMGDPGPMGGRRPIGLSIVGNKGYFLGVEMRTSNCLALLVDLKGNIKQEYLMDYKKGDISNAISALSEIIRKLPRDIALKGMGIALPGIVNHRKGIIEKSFPLNITEPFDLGKNLKEKFDFPFLLENDANCGCWSEMSGFEDDSSINLLYLTGTLNRQIKIDQQSRGTGVGAGIIINGRVLHGKNHSAGEFRSAFLQDKSSGQFASHDENEIIEELASNVAMIINTFNIDQLVLGGDFPGLGDQLLNRFSKHAEQNWAYEGPSQCLFRFSRQGDRDVAYGAASMCLDRFYSS